MRRRLRRHRRKRHRRKRPAVHGQCGRVPGCNRRRSRRCRHRRERALLDRRGEGGGHRLERPRDRRQGDRGGGDRRPETSTLGASAEAWTTRTIALPAGGSTFVIGSVGAAGVAGPGSAAPGDPSCGWLVHAVRAASMLTTTTAERIFLHGVCLPNVQSAARHACGVRGGQLARWIASDPALSSVAALSKHVFAGAMDPDAGLERFFRFAVFSVADADISRPPRCSCPRATRGGGTSSSAPSGQPGSGAPRTPRDPW